jgi:hypothetical protein
MNSKARELQAQTGDVTKPGRSTTGSSFAHYTAGKSMVRALHCTQAAHAQQQLLCILNTQSNIMC